jgi:hypothetical protein
MARPLLEPPAMPRNLRLVAQTIGVLGVLSGLILAACDLGAFERGAPPWSAGSSLTSDGF